jgi:hypothetical protein
MKWFGMECRRKKSGNFSPFEIKLCMYLWNVSTFNLWTNVLEHVPMIRGSYDKLEKIRNDCLYFCVTYLHMVLFFSVNRRIKSCFQFFSFLFYFFQFVSKWLFLTNFDHARMEILLAMPNAKVFLTHKYLGLPDGLFSNQKSQFGLIFEGLVIDVVGICYGHRVYFVAIFRSFGIFSRFDMLYPK